MEATDQAPRRGSYFAVLGEVREFRTQAELKSHIANHNEEDGVLEVIKGKPVTVTVENKPVISLDV